MAAGADGVAVGAGHGRGGIAKVTFTSPDRVREVINNFNDDGFESLYPKYAGGRPPTFTLPQRQAIKKIALSRPVDHGLPFSTWSLSKLAEFLVAEGVVDDISHEGLRDLLRKEGVAFKWSRPGSSPPIPTTSRRRTGSSSSTTSPRARPNRAEAIRRWCSRWTSSGRSTCCPARASSGRRSSRGGLEGSTSSPRRRRRRATYKRTQGVRHLFAALDLGH